MLRIVQHSKINYFTFSFFLVALILLTHNIEADVISINSGGGTEISLDSNPYIEGFFSGISESTDSSSNSSSSGSSSSGGGGSVTVTPSNVEVSPKQLNITMLIGTQTERTITVTNPGNSTLTLRASQQNLGTRMIFEDASLIMPGGGFDELKLTFFALDEPGVYSGKIFIGAHQVLVTIIVKTELILFDSNITIFEPESTISQGQNLTTVLKLTPQANPEETNVSLTFTIKDSTGKVVLTKSEVLTIDEAVELTRSFDTSSLEPGDYTITIDVIAPDGTLSSTASFKVAKGPVTSSFSGKIIVLLIMMLLVLGILITLYFIWRYRKKSRQIPPANLENFK